MKCGLQLKPCRQTKDRKPDRQERNVVTSEGTPRQERSPELHTRKNGLRRAGSKTVNHRSAGPLNRGSEDTSRRRPCSAKIVTRQIGEIQVKTTRTGGSRTKNRRQTRCWSRTEPERSKNRILLRDACGLDTISWQGTSTPSCNTNHYKTQSSRQIGGLLLEKQ
jgi:hypothetical protein